MKTFTLEEVAEVTKSALVGLPHYRISNVADLESATPEDASFLANARYSKSMARSKAGVIFIHPLVSREENHNFLLNDNPSLAFQQLVDAFYDKEKAKSGFQAIHPTAIIHPTVNLGKGVSIGPYVVIDKGATIGDNTCIHAGCSIGAHVIIGEECLLHPHVVIRECCTLSNRVIIQPGAIIGSCGFGYVMNEAGRHIKLNQVGAVFIEDDVEIGANATIDRARFKTTRIRRGTKIDNLVQIAHGVDIGTDNIIVAQTGIAGSTETGHHVMIGGQAALNGHIKVANKVRIAARSGVSKSLFEEGMTYGGEPAIPLHEHNRNSVLLRRIETYINEVKALKEELSSLKAARSSRHNRFLHFLTITLPSLFTKWK